ncbi:MAG: YcxB family protein, partial [Bacteroidota bacterium]
MTVTYTLQKEDFLTFQLFTASTSKRIQEKKKNSWLGITVVFLMVAAFFYLERNNFLAIWFGVSAVITGIFYPTYFNWTHMKHYKKYVEEHNINRFGQEENLTIREDVISSQNNLGDGNIKISAITEIAETETHFFLKMISGLSLIIPKRGS